jgi:hypothetical protein
MAMGNSTRPQEPGWIFTFAAGHRLGITPDLGAGSDPVAPGVQLGDRFVVVHAATEAAARQAWVTLFGPATFQAVYGDNVRTRAAMAARGARELPFVRVQATLRRAS